MTTTEQTTIDTLATQARVTPRDVTNFLATLIPHVDATDLTEAGIEAAMCRMIDGQADFIQKVRGHSLMQEYVEGMGRRFYATVRAERAA